MGSAFAEIAFTQEVRKRQEQEGSRRSYSGLDDMSVARGDELSQTEAAFIRARDGFYQATVSETGWPYVQFRGGPAGFLKVLDARTIAYADFRGNRQYISSGNLVSNERVSLFLMDYPNRRRLKIWARATQISVLDDQDLVASLMPEDYRALPERAVKLTVEAFDWNCPQHIPQRYTLKELAPDIMALQNRITELESENAELKEFLNPKT
jgi:uncharacterized protein